jgi:hypothetical protein
MVVSFREETGNSPRQSTIESLDFLDKKDISNRKKDHRSSQVPQDTAVSRVGKYLGDSHAGEADSGSIQLRIVVSGLSCTLKKHQYDTVQ